MREPFDSVTGRAAPFPAANIDTDVIMPKQFLKGIDRGGLAGGVFHGLRVLPDGTDDPDFILNRAPWRDAVFLVTGPNFGCGSSREHAVWGLRQRGVRAILGSSFGEIFYDNCARNGLLALKLPAAELERLFELAADPARNLLSVDLGRQTILPAEGPSIPFRIPPPLKAQLLAGLDPVGQTLLHHADIKAFEERLHRARPWLARPSQIY